MKEGVISPIVTADTESILVKKHGFRMFINPKMILPKWINIEKNGLYERHQVELLKKECKNGMTFVDLGARHGYYTFIGATLVGSKGRVFAFEPNPDCYQRIMKGIKANGFANIIPVCKAVSNKTGLTVDIIQPYLIPFKDVVIPSQTVALDDFFKDYGRNIDIIKMDIEGAEVFALEGMKQLLKKDLKIFLELHPVFIRQFGSTPFDCLNVLIRNGFTIYKQEQSHELIEVDLDNIADTVEHYLCTKR